MARLELHGLASAQEEAEEVAWAKSEEAKAAASGGNGLRAAPLKFTFSIIHTIGRNLIFGLKI